MSENRAVQIKTEFIKLDQLLKFAGLTETGGAAKDAVAGGGVLVNGQPCLQRGRKLRAGDVVSFSGTTLRVEGP